MLTSTEYQPNQLQGSIQSGPTWMEPETLVRKRTLAHRDCRGDESPRTNSPP